MLDPTNGAFVESLFAERDKARAERDAAHARIAELEAALLRCPPDCIANLCAVLGGPNTNDQHHAS